MSAYRIAGSDALAALRAHLAMHHTVMQPLPDSDGNLHWQEADSAAPLPAQIALPAFSPKALLFAERESLFSFDGHVFRETPAAPQALALFGVSACDLAAIHYQDRFFSGDPWYTARRAAVLLVGIDCTAPCHGGFCPLTDSGPFVRSEHADLILHPLQGDDSGDWLLFVGTARGAQALQGLPLSCAAATQRPAFLSAQEPAVVAQFPADGALRRGIAALNAHAVPHAQWQQLGTECITCSGCSNVCPTCSCFATRQENRQGADLAVAVQNDSRRIASHDDQKGIATVRFWDSCLYEGFQREASGHNPSQAAGARIERYWTHKFGDAFVARFGRYTCVGCGRCDRVCPSGIGATAALKRIGEAGADNVESNGSTSP